MRQCPFCGAEITENARFCLYCMARLTEATPIQASSKRSIRWWGILTAVFVLCAALCVAVAARRPHETEDGVLAVAATTTQRTTAATTAKPTTSSLTVTTTATVAETTAAVTTEASKTTAPVTTTAFATTTATATEQTTTTTTTTTTTATTTAVTTTTARATSAATTATTAGTTVTTIAPPSDTPRVYWRTADTETTAVITGFESLPSNGILRIPATVDGKTVVGFDMRQAQGLAFDIPSVCRRITTLYLPPSVQRVPDDVFVHFTNLTDLYIGSYFFYLPPSALPAVEVRTVPLTLHTPKNARSTFANESFSVCCASTYAAAHAVWDPTDVYTEGNV